MMTYAVLASALEKLDNSRRLQRNPRKCVRERCRTILLPYLEAAVERFEKARTVAGKYELRWCTTKVKDMYHPFAMETRRLIAWSDPTITFTNPKGQRRDLLAVVVAKERWGDAYNPLLAYMGKPISDGLLPQAAGREEEMLTLEIGIVHRNRKDRGKKNSAVYGIATDGYTFQILKIDNKSKVKSCEQSGG
jgi:hypothetical protein